MLRQRLSLFLSGRASFVFALLGASVLAAALGASVLAAALGASVLAAAPGGAVQQRRSGDGENVRRISGRIVAESFTVGAHEVVEAVDDVVIECRGPIVIQGTLRGATKSGGPIAHGASLELRSKASIAIHGRLSAGPGGAGVSAGATGGSGGDINLIAPRITSADPILGAPGGVGGAGGRGGDGGDVVVSARAAGVAIVGGAGGRGGDGDAASGLIDAGPGGNGPG